MKMKALILGIALVACFYAPPVFASWVMEPNEETACPLGFEIAHIQTPSDGIYACIPQKALAPPPQPNPQRQRPHEGTPLEGPHFEGG